MGELGEVVAGAEDAASAGAGGRGGAAEDDDVRQAGALGAVAGCVDEPGVLVDFRVGVMGAFGGSGGGGFEGREEGRVEGGQEAQLAVHGGGVVGVELGAEIAEDGEGEGVAAGRVVQGQVGGAGGEGRPARGY